MKSLSTWFNKFTPIQQLALIVIACVLIYMLKKRYDVWQAAQNSGLAAQAEITVLANNGIKPSYKQATYDSWSDQLYKAVKGAGTNEAAIYNVFKWINNDADFIKLNQAFGVRDEMTMKAWLYDDLDGSDISAINAGLKVKGMTKFI